MRTEIKPGASFDTLTQDELRTLLEEFASGYLRPPQHVRFENGVTLDSSGDGTVDVYRPNLGYLFLLNRLVVDTSPGHTFGNPYQAAGGYLQILVGGQTYDGAGFTVASPGDNITLPAVFTATDSYAVWARDGETVQLQLVAGPASAAVMVRGTGLLIPLPPD